MGAITEEKTGNANTEAKIETTTKAETERAETDTEGVKIETRAEEATLEATPENVQVNLQAEGKSGVIEGALVGEIKRVDTKEEQTAQNDGVKELGEKFKKKLWISRDYRNQNGNDVHTVYASLCFILPKQKNKELNVRD